VSVKHSRGSRSNTTYPSLPIRGRSAAQSSPTTDWTTVAPDTSRTGPAQRRSAPSDTRYHLASTRYTRDPSPSKKLNRPVRLHAPSPNFPLRGAQRRTRIEGQSPTPKTVSSITNPGAQAFSPSIQRTAIGWSDKEGY
jgi:hypothetical protein